MLAGGQAVEYSAEDPRYIGEQGKFWCLWQQGVCGNVDDLNVDALLVQPCG